MQQKSPELSMAHYVRNSVRQYWRVQLAVAMGVMVSVAVLSGAFLIGDSVRQSLRRLTIERLGRIETALISDHFFPLDLMHRLVKSEPRDDEGPTTRELSAELASQTGFSEAQGIILLPQVTVEKKALAGAGADESAGRRASQVTVVGCDANFWRLASTVVTPPRLPEGRQILLNEPLAKELQVRLGDQLSVRLAKESRIAADSTMAHKTDRVQSITELEVVGIIPAQGLGRFSLQANQALPRTAWIPLTTIQRALDLDGKINAILLATNSADSPRSAAQQAAIAAAFRPTLSDAGLRLAPVDLSYRAEDSGPDTTVQQYWNLTTDSLLFAPPAQKRIELALKGLSHDRVLTYLANSIDRARDAQMGSIESPTPKSGIPYSTVSAIEPDSPLSPLGDLADSTKLGLKENEIALNSWAATDLGVKPGDTIRLSFFAPETTHGDPQELTADFLLSSIVPLTEPTTPFRRNRPAQYSNPPTRANDPHLTPEVPGITDQESIDAWDPPFPFDYDRIRKPKDDDYWNAHRTTPKAFINLSAGQRLWSSRFGQVSSFRIARDVSAQDVQEAELHRRIETAIHEAPEDFGFAFLPLKRDGLLAAKGTTPFQFLFLGFSMFLIAAALMLVALLFRLGVEQRSREIGLLAAMGFTTRRIQTLFLREGLAIACLGGAAGIVASIGYAALMLAGLRTWWLDAVVTPFIGLQVEPASLLLGIVLGSSAALLTILGTLRSMKRWTVRQLLGGSLEATTPTGTTKPNRTRVAWIFWLSALLLLLLAGRLQGEAQAGSFFGGGVMVLTALLYQTRQSLFLASVGRSTRRGGLGLLHFVIQNLRRNPGRSTLTLGLMATACFLIVAISAFRLSPTEQGTGGFNLMAISDQPIFDDLNDPAVRQDRWNEKVGVFKDVHIEPARLRTGDDASCRNLYQVGQPQLIGLPSSVVERLGADGQSGFAFASSAAKSEQERRNPWTLLQPADSSQASAIPVILDKNTAMYSLHLYGGVGQEFELDYGADGKKTFRIVGLLANSVLQGSLIVSESELVRHFPEVTGYRFFLISGPEEQMAKARTLLEATFSDEGIEMTDTRQRLAELLAVQNTYLSTFQSLGGLGLLLGTFGLVAVQLRSVFERRTELALMQATGFSRRRIAQVVLLEHFLLLVGGLGIGLLAAFLTVLPQAFTQDVQPPWMALATILVVIMAVGMTTGAWVLRPVLRTPLLAALRGD